MNTTTKHITFLFTSDEHGHLKTAGNLQTQVARARQENPEGTLLVSSGDVFEGACETGVLGTDASRELLQKAGYDVMTAGNHDFDRGGDFAKQWVKEAPCKVLLSNVTDTATGQLLEGTEPSHIYELDGVKVGLIGVTTPETAKILPASKQEGIAFQDPATCVRQQMDKLKAEGAEVIGLISHVGLPADRELARQLPELDFILGGHTHDALPAPEVIGHTLIAHPGCYRQSMGRLDLFLNDNHLTHDYRLIKAAEEPAQNGEVQSFVDDKEAQVQAAMGQTLTHLQHPLAYDPNELGDPMELMVGAALVEASQADLTVFNQKGVRCGLEAGPVTRGDVFNVFPFDNRLVTIDMSAAEVTSLFDESYRRYDQTSLATSGPVSYAVDRKSREGFLVQRFDRATAANDNRCDLDNLVADIPGCDTVTGRLRPDENISLATVDYLVAGGLRYMEPGRPATGDFGLMRDVLENYLASGDLAAA